MAMKMTSTATIPPDRRANEPEILDAHITAYSGLGPVIENGRLRYVATAKADPARYDPGDDLARAEILVERYLATMLATGINGMVLQGPTMLSATEVDPENRHGPSISYESPSVVSVISSRYPDTFAYWLRVDHKTKDLAGVVREAKKRAGCLAIRCIVMTNSDPEQKGAAAFRAGAFEPLFRAAAEQGFPINLFAPYHLDQVPRIVERYPDLVLTLDHLGLPPMPYMREPDPFVHLPQLVTLARYPNVAVKLSGAASLSAEPFPFRDIQSPLRKVIDAFGPERCIWASDFNRCLPLHTLGEAVTFMKYGDWLTDAERRLILAGALRRRYGWPRTTRATGRAR